MDSVDYQNTFIAIADDCPVGSGEVPKPGSVAGMQHEMLAEHPYEFTSGDVIFDVWADRKGIAAEDRADERAAFYAKNQACLRASPLGKRHGWGVHANPEGKVAIYALGSPEYEALLGGTAPDGTPVTVKKALRTKRA